MPLNMRQFYLQELIDIKKKENEQSKKGSSPKGKHPKPPRPNR